MEFTYDGTNFIMGPTEGQITDLNASLTNIYELYKLSGNTTVDNIGTETNPTTMVNLPNALAKGTWLITTDVLCMGLDRFLDVIAYNSSNEVVFQEKARFQGTSEGTNMCMIVKVDSVASLKVVLTRINNTSATFYVLNIRGMKLS